MALIRGINNISILKCAYSKTKGDNKMKEFNEKDFLDKYHGSDKFLSEGAKYYKLFLELLKDKELLDKIKFANDVLRVPPIESFIKYHRDYLKKDVFNEKLPSAIKQGFGALFGYLYRFIYGGYEPKQAWINDQITGIKTASRFELK